MPLFCVILKKFGNFRGILCKSRWQSHNYGQFTITMSSSKLLQRDRATPTVLIPSRLINSRLNAQYWPIYRFDKKSYMSFRLVPKSVTLNDLELQNGPYFALFYRIRVRCRRKTIVRFTVPWFQNILLILYDHINTICPLIQHYLGKANSDNSVWCARRINDWLHYIDYHWRLVTVEIRNSV